jgi:small conductance mechanosensitive channel
MQDFGELVGPEQLQAIIEVVTRFGLQVLAAIAVFVIGRWLARRISLLIQRGLKRANTDPALIGFFGNISYFGILVLVVVAAVGQLGVQTTSFIAVLGAAGLAIGLALQGSLANFAAGMLLILFRPFKAGDFIEAAGSAGIVEEIELFTTRLRTPDNKTVIVPNAQVTSGSITNYSDRETRRLDLEFGVSYGDDLDRVRQIIGEVLGEEARLLSEPEPTVGLLSLGDSSVNFAVRPWVRSEDYWPVHFAVQEAMKKRFDREGISIPFPQRDVHLFKQAS